MRSELLKKLWENEKVELVGVQGTYRQEIDRDQAIFDETGKAAYKSYILIYSDELIYEFTAEEIEAFSRTW